MNRSNIVTDSINTLKMIHIKKSEKKKKKVRHGKWAGCVGWWKENLGRFPEAGF